MARVAVTGAAGHLGRDVSGLLLGRLDPAEVVLITRRPENIADLARRGADVRRADFDDPGATAAAFADVDRALLISTHAIGKRLRRHVVAIDAASVAGVRHLVYTSVVAPFESNPAVVAPEHRETEQALRESGLDWTVLRNSLYAEFQVETVLEAAAAGEIVTNAGDGRVAYVSREDCAAAAAAVLTSEGHEGMVYDITGPEQVSQDDLAALASEFGDTSVRVVQLDDEAFVATLIAGGRPDPFARGIASFGVAARGGWLDRMSLAVEDLTGRPPRSLRELLAAHRAELSGASR